MLTADRLRQVLRYDADTGEFVWIARTSNRIRIGDVAGRPHNRGYTMIGVDGGLYLAHRLAWLWMTGGWPQKQVDHINGVRDDNRWRNLREATTVQNAGNSRRHRDKRAGAKGVYRTSGGLWQARIGHKYLGTRETHDEAQALYEQAARERFGEFARTA